jgi:hypothetical protein
MKKFRFPKTDSIEQLAEFWDTRDLTDFEDELEEVVESNIFIQTTLEVVEGAMSNGLPQENKAPDRKPGWLALLKAITIGPSTPLSEKLVGPTYGAIVGMGVGGYFGARDWGILGLILGVILGFLVGAVVGALSVFVIRV